MKNNADCTISVYQVPIEEASRFGILVTDKKQQIVEFVEKPARPTSNLASMGIYIFKYKVLKKYLIEDAKEEKSSHDFGKNIIPMMLKDNRKMMAYVYKGYWKDVGTISSLHEANMDLLKDNSTLDELTNANRIYSEDTNSHPQYIGSNASVSESLINQGAVILGHVKRSVISNEVLVGENAVVENSVLMTGAIIRNGAVVKNAVVAPNSVVLENDVIDSEEVTLYAKRMVRSHE